MSQNEEVNPLKNKTRNKKFDSTSKLVESIEISGHQMLVQQLPLSNLPKSKLLGVDPDAGMFFNFKRGIIVKKGPECKRDYQNVGDEVYFSPMVFVNINYPNPDKSDKLFSIISEENVIYYIKKS
jgi:hypothetical protein